MRISVKRVYDKPTKQDGCRILIDRLWPRGVAKADAKIDIQLKELTPTNELRKWFHEDKKGRYNDFVKKYRKELNSLSEESLNDLRKCKSVTLVTAVKDIGNSHVPVLREFLEKSKKI